VVNQGWPFKSIGPTVAITDFASLLHVGQFQQKTGKNRAKSPQISLISPEFPWKPLRCDAYVEAGQRGLQNLDEQASEGHFVPRSGAIT
jgi:hypothetical protein